MVLLVFMNGSERFLKACRMEPVDCTPVWFLRQAGRYMAEYRSIRERYRLLEMFKSPELVAEITLQPVKAFSVDAAIIFADILLPLEGMGVGIDFVEREGPVIHRPVRTLADAEQLRAVDPEEDLGYVLKGLRMVRAEIEGRVALIGFAGAPFTLASYMIEGGSSRSFLLTKKIMYEHPRTWDTLMSKLADTIAAYLIAQYHAGAQVLQLFDSWVGCLGPADYRDYALPYSRRVLQALAQANIPGIHFGTGTADLLPLMREAGGNVIGIDWRTYLDDAWRRLGTTVGIQGNLDPVALFAPWQLLRSRAQDILDRASGRPGHVFNVGHGILPATPVDSVKALADFVHEYRP